MLVYLSEGGVHIECLGRCDLCRRELLLELLLDLLEKDHCRFGLEGALSETDVKDVGVFDDEVVVSA